MVHAFVTPRLGYYNILYMGLSLKMVQKVQSVQNVAPCMVTGTTVDGLTVGPLVQRLSWFSHSFPGPIQSAGIGLLSTSFGSSLSERLSSSGLPS